MLLKIQDRLALLSVLPQTGDIMQVKVVRDIREKLVFPETEQEALGFVKTPDGQVNFDPEKDVGAEFSFGPRALVIIKDTLKSLSDKKELSLMHVGIWDLFMEKVETGEEVTVLKPDTQ